MNTQACSIYVCTYVDVCLSSASLHRVFSVTQVCSQTKDKDLGERQSWRYVRDNVLIRSYSANIRNQNETSLNQKRIYLL